MDLGIEHNKLSSSKLVIFLNRDPRGSGPRLSLEGEGGQGWGGGRMA